jgi:tetrahydromethanopterin S-methyltransferase subunit F
MLMKEEKFLKGYTHKTAQVSRIHAYVEDLKGQEA